MRKTTGHASFLKFRNNRNAYDRLPLRQFGLNGRARTFPIRFRKIPPRGIHADELTARWLLSAAVNPVQTSDIPTKIARIDRHTACLPFPPERSPIERSNANDQDG